MPSYVLEPGARSPVVLSALMGLIRELSMTRFRPLVLASYRASSARPTSDSQSSPGTAHVSPIEQVTMIIVPAALNGSIWTARCRSSTRRAPFPLLS